MNDLENEKPEINENSSGLGEEPSSDEARREFMKKCGRYAVFTAPAVTALLFMEGAVNPGLAESG